MSRRVEIRFVSPSCALVSGPRTRRMLTDLTGRPPVWATRDRAWVVQPHRARDPVAILEHRGGWDITVTNHDVLRRDHHDAHRDVQEPSLW